MKNATKTTMLLLSALYMILGIPLMIWPLGAARVICFILGAVCAGYGILRTIVYFTKRDEPLGGFGLVLGVILLLMGIALIFAVDSVISIFGIFVGIVILINSILKLQIALNIKRTGENSWQLVLILAVLMLIVGLLLIINPFATAAIASIVAGIALFIDGAVNLYSVIKAGQLL